MTAHKVNKKIQELLIFIAILFILTLTASNIQNSLKPKKVLGIKTKYSNEEIFWNNFLEKNPNYIPGWIEIGRNDKASQIDPNYR